MTATHLGIRMPLFALLAATSVGAADKPAAPEPVRWYEASSVGVRVVGMKKEIALDAEGAAKIFAGNFLLRDGWEKHIPAKVETAADAATIPDGVKTHWQPAREAKPHAHVLRFTAKEVVVLIVRHEGTYLTHQFHECLARFRLPRGKAVDKLLDMATSDGLYASTHKGLEQGSTADAVEKALGKPDATESYQVVGYYRQYYFADDVCVTIRDGRVESMSKKLSKELVAELKKKGPHIVRY